MRAFILIHVEAGRAAEVTRAIRRISKVDRAYMVDGPYDVIAEAEADHHGELVRDVVDAIRSTPGVVRLVTCPLAGHHLLSMAAVPSRQLVTMPRPRPIVPVRLP